MSSGTSSFFNFIFIFIMSIETFLVSWKVEFLSRSQGAYVVLQSCKPPYCQVKGLFVVSKGDILFCSHLNETNFSSFFYFILNGCMRNKRI